MAAVIPTASDETQANFAIGHGHCRDLGSRSVQEDQYQEIADLNVHLEGGPGPGAPRRLYSGVFDGHGGQAAAIFCREKMHLHLVNSPNFAQGNYEEALRDAFRATEEEWYEMATTQLAGDPSGACACVALVIDNTLYVASVGDCRAVLFHENGGATQITRDHKPNDEQERERITSIGGEVRQKTIERQAFLCWKARTVPIGPFRVFPGKLAVARSIGTIRSKYKDYGGLPGCVLSEPDVFTRQLTTDDNLLIMASDGVWDNVKVNTELSKPIIREVLKAHAQRKSRATAAASAAVAYSKRKCKNKSQQDNTTAVCLFIKHSMDEEGGEGDAGAEG